MTNVLKGRIARSSHTRLTVVSGPDHANWIGVSRRHNGSLLINVEKIELSGHLLIAKRFTERVVKTTKTAQRVFIAQQIDEARMPLPG